MGLLVEGRWVDRWYDTDKSAGRFERSETAFRSWLTADGSSGFKAEPGRYHLYVSYACPWAHRTLIMRNLKGLEDAVSVSVVDPVMASDGWTLSVGADPVNDARFLHEVYTLAEPRYSGRVTVPVLWDRERATVVNNESAEIVRMFNSAFAGLSVDDRDFYPAHLRDEIDRINADVYDNVNNGVYKAGFATRQRAYEHAYDALFAALDRLEDRLARQRYLVGDTLTEADWRLFTTLLRFDPVYHGHFKCNRQRLADFASLWPYARGLYQVPGVAETVHFDHIKRHYYASHPTINPTGIVPKGPELDWTEPHERS
ncbi:MAG: glutathione S-transferase family protein [Proteobacteria bacterium]|nr:glutathione S-transferase family protein [Pseudomonadota bacterium]